MGLLAAAQRSSEVRAMNEPYSSLGSLLVAKEGIGPSYVGVGIPQGIFVDGASGETAGVVRRGGELMSLNKVEYAMWTILLPPITLTAATVARTEVVQQRMSLTGVCECGEGDRIRDEQP
jgi:hypothetical protein